MLTKKDNAYHESGHAVTAYLYGFTINKISLVPLDKNKLAYIEIENPLYNSNIESGEELIKKTIIHNLIGSMAKDKYINQEWSLDSLGGENDIKFVMWLLENNYTVNGYSPEEVKQILDNLILQTKKLLNQVNIWKAIEDLANAMLEKNNLTIKEALSIIKNAIKGRGA